MTEQTQARQRIVIDTNVLLPVLEYRGPETNWLAKLWMTRQVTPLVNRETIFELRGKLVERNLSLKLQKARAFADSRIRKYEPWCEPVALETNPSNPQCSDPRDQMFIDLAIAGNAEILVARDRAIRCMKNRVAFEIMDAQEFRRRTRS